ncbi:MAG: di-trans,poly-cis-decaprenylcistransferase [Treponema sp.]|nr:di-trans,poly-cis-decaprenylcistransferase [Treponema sp.]
MAERNTSPLPRHVGIIMDGNGRWAEQRGLVRTKGHTEGLSAAKRIAKAAADMGLPYLTLYVFSTENWKRTQQEVGFLMNLIHTHLRAEFQFYKENGIRVRCIGDRSGLDTAVQADIATVEAETRAFTGLTLALAINYGSRNELLRAMQKLCVSSPSLATTTEQDISNHLETPDLDLLIRTGGERRLSNFLLWQAAYAELVFTDTLWPDYTAEDFSSHLSEFQHRTRRFGGTP